MCARVLNGRKRDVLYALESNNRACVLRRITEEVVRRGSLSANYTVERKKHPSSRKRIHSRTVNVAIAQSLATYLYIHTDRHAVQSPSLCTHTTTSSISTSNTLHYHHCSVSKPASAAAAAPFKCLHSAERALQTRKKERLRKRKRER